MGVHSRKALKGYYEFYIREAIDAARSVLTEKEIKAAVKEALAESDWKDKP